MSATQVMEVELDADGRYVGANDAALDVLGYTADELLALAPGGISRADPEEVRRFWSRFVAGEIAIPENRPAEIVTKRGSVLAVQVLEVVPRGAGRWVSRLVLVSRHRVDVSAPGALQAILAAWRGVQARLDAADEDDPARPDLEAEVAELRDLYQREARLRTGLPAAIVAFPSADRAFASYVQASARGATTIELLEARLRRWYPGATVEERDDVGGHRVGPRTWYAYRDGDAYRLDAGEWWTAPDVAQVHFDRGGTFCGSNAAADRLAGAALVGRPTASVRPPEQAADPEWLWQVIESDGVAMSVGRLRAADGSERLIEFRSGPAPEPGRYVSWWRPVTVIGPGDEEAEGSRG